MPNGHDPPRRLSDSAYQTIKNGWLVGSGTYAGCIQVGESTYYWIAPDGTDWELNQGAPDETQTAITSDVWAKCKAGGTLTWLIRGEAWQDSQSQTYRWAGDSGEDVHLVEL